MPPEFYLLISVPICVYCNAIITSRVLLAKSGGIFITQSSERRHNAHGAGNFVPLLDTVFISLCALFTQGDVVTTVHHGVRLVMKPRAFMQTDDVVELGIDSLGKHRQIVTAFNK